MNLGELKSEFDALFPAGAVTDTEKTRWFNNACLDMVRKTHCLTGYEYKTMVAETQWYNLSSYFLFVEPKQGVIWQDSDDDYHRLEATTWTELDQEDSDWINADSGTPTEYLIDTYAGVQRIGLYLKPDTAQDDGLKINAVYKPKALSSNADIPFTPVLPTTSSQAKETLEPYHYLIVSYALWKAKQKRGKFTQARDFRDEYFNGVSLMKGELGEQPDYRPHWKTDEDYFKWTP